MWGHLARPHPEHGDHHEKSYFDTTTLSSSRRSLLAGTPLAALFTLTPHATLSQVRAAIQGPEKLLDAEVIHGCGTIMRTYNNWKGGEDYASVCRTIEEHAEVIAPIPASTLAALQAKASVVHMLTKIGMASYAYRILAASLAADVLAGGLA